MGIAAALKTASSTSTFLDTFIKQSPLPNAIMKEINNIHNVKDMLQAPPLRVTEVADCILTALIGGGNHSSILYPKDILQLSKKWVVSCMYYATHTHIYISYLLRIYLIFVHDTDVVIKKVSVVIVFCNIFTVTFDTKHHFHSILNF